MDGPIIQFRSMLAQLRDVATAAQSLRDYFAGDPGSGDVPEDLVAVVARYRALKLRSFESDGIIVLLYGCFERYVEDVVRGVLYRLSSRLQYGHLPGSVRQDHLRRSARLMLNDRALAHLRETDRLVLEKAWQCDSGRVPYQLNVGAFTLRDANMRHGVVDELFKGIGCDNACSRTRLQRPFSEWFRQAHGREAPSELDSVFDMLTKLVDLRNDIAHGSSRTSLDLGEVLRMIEFVQALGESLHLVAREHALVTECDCRGVALPTPLNIFDNRIVCFEVQGVIIRAGDWLVATLGDGARMCGRIEQLQVSKVVVDSVDSTFNSVQVGLQLDNHAKEGWQWRLVSE